MNELVAALAKAQGQMKMAEFDAVNPAFKKPDGKASRYATLASIINAVRPALSANGIAYIQRVAPSDAGVTVETVFYGHGGELATGPVLVPVDKRTAQGIGSALTYARRFSLAMACGIAADDDDDGQVAESVAPGSTEKLRGEYVIALQDAISAAGMTAEKFCTAYGIGSLVELPADRYEGAMKRLADRAAKLAKDAA